MSYFSLRIESFIIFSYTSNLTAPLEDVIFYLALGNAASAKIFWGTDLVFETDPYICYGKFLTEQDRCCAQMKTFHVHDINITGIIPYYLRIDYKHKESEPCIRLYRESPTMSFYDLSNDSYSMTELKASPFFINPLINLELRATKNSTLEIPKFIDTNTNKYIPDMSLQATIQNLILVHPRDIYGNIVLGEKQLVFEAELNDGINTVKGVSSYNTVLRRYEIFITPIMTNNEAILTITSQNVDIQGSPFTINIIPGPYSLQHSDWIEWNGDGEQYCLINLICSIKIVLRDSNKNIVAVPLVLTNQDVDVVMYGPQGTLYITQIDNSESSEGNYYIKYSRLLVGKYSLFIRLRQQKAGVYPMEINIFTEIIEPARTFLISKNYAIQRSGVTFKLQVQVQDLFGNYVEPGAAKLGFAQFITTFQNMNLTNEVVQDEGYEHIGQGIYEFTVTLFKRGNYKFTINLEDNEGVYRSIVGSPFSLEVQPHNTSWRYSFVNGTGVDIVNGVFVGRVEQINLFVKDIYDNYYNQTTFMGFKHYNISGACNGTIDVPINDTISVPIYGYYKLEYILLKYCENITVQVKVLTYDPDTDKPVLKHIIGSPFVVPVAFQDLILYESDQDLSLTGFGVSNNSEVFLMPPVVYAGEHFQMRVFPKNIQGVNFVYYESTALYFVVEFTPLTDPKQPFVNMTICNCREQFQRYCSFFSYSKEECLKLPACMWTHNELGTTYNSSYQSCSPCSQGCEANNAMGMKQKKYLQQLKDYEYSQSNDNIFYYFDMHLTISGTYLLTIGGWRIGLLTVTLYQNDDLTDFKYSFPISHLSLIFDENLHIFFRDHDQSYSMVIQGMIRADYSNLYTFTVSSNKEIEVYFDGERMISKPQEVKEERSFQREMTSHELLQLEIRVKDKERELEDGKQLRGYFKMWEECGNLKRRLIKNKNIFQFNHIVGSNNRTLIVNATSASILHSEVFEANNQVIKDRNDSYFRASVIMTFEFIVRDRFGNVRGNGYDDVLEMNATLNNAAESSIRLANQDSETGHYLVNYQFKHVGVYVVYFYLNGFRMASNFTFTVTNDVLSPLYTETLFLGYLTYVERDCVFVNRHFYVVFTMRDQFNNTIPYYDTFAFTSAIKADLTHGIIYDLEKCRPYQYEQIDKIQCPFEASNIGDDQILTMYQSHTLDLFAGFPMSISVKPFRQEGFKIDGTNPIDKVSEKVISDSGEISRVYLSFTARDVYGNQMIEDSICSFFTHYRFLLYFNFVYKGASPQSQLKNVQTSVTESLSLQTSKKTFIIDGLRPALMSFDSIYLNYTLYDGLNYKNGILVKYYTNNNMQGKPLFITRIPSTFIDSIEYNSNWYMFHKEFKDFSVKFTSLVYVPKDVGRRISFVTTFTQRLQLFVNDQLVIENGKTTGSIDLPGDGCWIKLKILYRYSGSTINQVVPQFKVQFQSAYLSLQYIENSPTGTIVVAMDPDDLDEPVLIRDMFKVARANFQVTKPKEASFPSTSHITISWDPIPESSDAGEEKILYYSLEWDQGPVKEWVELTTPGSIVTSYIQTTGFSSSITYSYRIRALDIIGYGPYSDVLSVVPKALPDQTETPVTVIEDISVKISWKKPFGNGADIIKFRVYVQHKDGIFYLENNHCDENNQTIFQLQHCYIPMSELTGPIYGLVKGDLIAAKVESASFIGFGPISLPNSIGAKAESIPLVPGTPARGAMTSHLKLHVTWPAIPDFTTFSGGDTCAILSYNLQWDRGNSFMNEWYDLKGFASNDNDVQFQTTVDIIGGTVYRVRVRAKNKHGWGTFSPIISIIAALVPGIPRSIATTQDVKNVILKWTKPDINGLEITQYEVLFKKSDGTYATTASCLGTDSDIINIRQCSVTYLTFRNDFGLVLNDLVVARIRAYNAYGWGLYSENTEGVLIKTEPKKPPNKIKRGVLTDETQLQIQWNTLVGDYTGREQILSYEIYWDAGTNGQNYEELHVARTPFTYYILLIDQATYPEVQPKQKYMFVYRATNQQGTGEFSDPAEIYTADIPSQMSPVQTSQSGTNIVIKWNPPALDNGMPVTKYRIQFKNYLKQLFEVTQYCNGADDQVIQNLQCSVPISIFKVNPFFLQVGDLIIAQGEAANLIGYSNPSNDNTAGVRMQSAPLIGVSNIASGPSTTSTQIQVTWNTLTSPDNGGNDVDYQVSWNQGSSIDTWVVLTESTSKATSFIQNTLITGGETYTFKVIAFNIFGYGPASTITIIAGALPSGLSAPTTIYDELSNSVTVYWSTPSDNGGLPITSYLLEIEDIDLTWVTVDQAAECDASLTLADGELGCRLMIDTLTGAKYRLTSGSLVIARVTANNLLGSVASQSDAISSALLP